ncbi:hypothetical protein L7F22_037978 [Adiantum nelumboides]|nr:hypothetical protein [Adiantum nelumboides]
MQRLVDSVLGVAKESLKAFSQEAFNNTVKLINGIAALILTFLPGKESILERVHGWELQPTCLRAPRLPRWMEDGVSTFNHFIHDYASGLDADVESEYESMVEDNYSFEPSSPSSQSSRMSSASCFHDANRNRNLYSFKGSTLSSVVPSFLWGLLGITPVQQLTTMDSSPISGSSTCSLNSMYGLASKGITSVKDFVVHYSTDRRRGIIEDLQLIVELFIERVFDVIRKVVLHCLSPLQTIKLFIGALFTPHNGTAGSTDVKTATLGDSNPAPSVKKEKRFPAMNTDARIAEDIVRDLGYPYEAMKVVTEDGYVLLLERIARPESQKVLFLQHGLLDSSMGWVKNGVVGSHAFAAHDHGYDVFLGNFRGFASQEHLDKKISSQRYWKFAIDEHGTKDIPAMIEKIRDLKMKELKNLNVTSSKVCDSNDQQPYTICGVAHSLGGAALLIYVVTRRLEGKPHHLSRLILLSPAGFHKEAPAPYDLYQYIFPAIAPIAFALIPGLYIKTWIFRGLFNKLARDFRNYPALGALVQFLCSYFIGGGDSSNWLEALGQSHYNMYDMPGIAYRVLVHLSQMRRADRFQMYDFGVAANIKTYGTSYPLDIGKHYGLINIPVDFVAGRKDKLIPKSNIRRHYQVLRDSGGTVSYKEFDYAHLEFTVAYREDLLAYVMSRLLLVTGPSTPSTSRSSSVKGGRTKGEVKRLGSSRHGKSAVLPNGNGTGTPSRDSGKEFLEEENNVYFVASNI